MIETLIDALTRAHALAGTVTLLAFWSAAFARKGSPFHRMVGRAYLVTMVVVIVTILPMTLSYFFEDQWVGGTFLLYLAVLVSHACLTAWRAIRYKRDFERFAGATFALGAVILGMAGLGVSALGWAFQSWLLIIFGLIGPISGIGAWKLRQSGPPDARWWLKQHYGAMIANGVATHIAFLQIGLMRVFPGLGDTAIQHLAWFGPLAVGLAAGVWLDRRYMRPAMQAAA